MSDITNKNGAITVSSKELYIQPIEGKPRGIRLFDKEPAEGVKPILEADSFESLKYTGDAGPNLVKGTLPPAVGKVVGGKKSPQIEIFTGDGDDRVLLARSKDADPRAAADPRPVVQINTGAGEDNTFVEVLPGSMILHGSTSAAGEEDHVNLAVDTKQPGRVAILKEGRTGKTAVGLIKDPKNYKKLISGDKDAKQGINTKGLFMKPNNGALEILEIPVPIPQRPAPGRRLEVA